MIADLHVHSKASKRPSEWFLKKVNARESYTDIDTLYKIAKQNKMDFVTVTDHNTIEGGLELIQKYPDDTFLSVEVTTYFPENNCKIHVLVFDITPEEFLNIEAIRHNIYFFRDYLKAQDIAYSVAHGFYNVNQKLSIEILEKLILLFDVFEGLNGARNRHYNEIWKGVLENLTQDMIKDLSEKHKIKPISDTPWIKGFTGGSDDHAGLFIGLTATVSNGAVSKKHFIAQIKDKKTYFKGRCNDYKSFAFSIYKIFCDYSSNGRKNSPGGIMSFFNDVVFEDRQSRLKKWITLRKIKKGKQIKDKIILKFFEDLHNWSHNKHLDMETKIESIYHSMGQLLDEFFKMLLESFVNDFSKGDIGKLFKNLMSALPALFVSFPFFSSLRHLSQDRDMILSLKKKCNGNDTLSDKKVLWFSDTINDLNGVSVTLNNFREQIVKRDLNVSFVTCVSKKHGPDKSNESNIMYLPCIYSVTPEFYASCSLNFPSLLASMEMIYQYRPDQIIVSTPGPVGILGMIMAGLLGIDCVSIYHTDFAAQAEYLFEDEALVGLIQVCINRFYSFSNRIKVPTNEYIKILSQQNYAMDKMSIFKRGFTVEDFKPSLSWKKAFKKEKGIKSGTILMWAGRVSKDKNLEFLIDTYQKACEKIPDLNLVLCGNGPDFEFFKSLCQPFDRIHLKGYVENKELQQYYEISDIFVFPSTTDTFGMVILEAQAKGLFALVTDVGGPREIIDNGVTGKVLSLSDADAWVEQICSVHTMKSECPNDFAMMRAACQDRIKTQYSWDEALNDILGGTKKMKSAISSPVSPRPDIALENDLVCLKSERILKKNVA
ncbi:glycosyltransferase [Desulfobacula toluolica]|uniref:Glycosyl transferase, family I n=1 Tax=Desulfobacula toluolica (strain DSM 7467 / Tol2) TaxID=651182 RepID=K0NIV4_DESTT|nr:glycosyltransferase [Desulfobacula toluolica]CCK81361.1 glycosyl transferase, family I [Desulfobacula toluolica Tol2]